MFYGGMLSACNDVGLKVVPTGPRVSGIKCSSCGWKDTIQCYMDELPSKAICTNCDLVVTINDGRIE